MPKSKEIILPFDVDFLHQKKFIQMEKVLLISMKEGDEDEKAALVKILEVRGGSIFPLSMAFLRLKGGELLGDRR